MPGPSCQCRFAISIAEALAVEAPDYLREVYKRAARQPMMHQAVIAEFGRHLHRNVVLGRECTSAELAYLAKGEFPHQTNLRE